MKFKLTIILAFFFSVTTLAADLPDLVFIVNADNPVMEVSTPDIRDYYFKRKRQWPDGESVRFIDRNLEVPLRDTFVKNILKKTNSDVELFWIGQKLYSGDSAPLRKTSDHGIIEFVSSFKGAIGYISAAAVSEFDLADMKVKVVKTVKPKD